MTSSAPRAVQDSPAAYRSLGLNALLEPMRCDRSYSILDLGPAIGGNVRFWSQFSCRLQIQDFYGGYRERKAAAAAGPEEESPETVFSALLPFGDETVFDVILVWDLFDYLELGELKAFVQRLGRWCRPGTRLFALVSNLPDIPASPTAFRIVNREQLIHELPAPATRPCPRHQPRDMARLMAQFRVASSFLLRHGIQEYVFEFK